MPFSPPSSPTNGQTFTTPNATYIWNTNKWINVNGYGTFLPLSGGTLSNPLSLSRDPITSNEVATKEYSDLFQTNRNKLINANFQVNQVAMDNWNDATAVINSGYPVDHWNLSSSVTGNLISCKQTATTVNNIETYTCPITTKSTGTLTTGQFSVLQQCIEIFQCNDLQWGTASGVHATLSFWAKSSIPGMWSGGIRNYVCTRSYVFTYTITQPNTWQYFIITIPPDTSGSWNMVYGSNTISDSNDSVSQPGGTSSSWVSVGALWVTFNYQTSSTYATTTPNVWTSSSNIGYNGTNTVTPLNTLNAYLSFANIQLEAGSVASPFEYIALEADCFRCQRYQTMGDLIYMMTSTNAGWNWCGFNFPLKMVYPPTIVLTCSTGYTPSLGGLTSKGFWLSVSTTGFIGQVQEVTFTAIAEL